MTLLLVNFGFNKKKGANSKNDQPGLSQKGYRNFLSILGIIVILAVAIPLIILFNLPVSDEIRVNTLKEWKVCQDQSKYKICEAIIGDENKLNEQITYPDHLNTTKECNNFWEFLKLKDQNELLPEDYFTCIEQSQEIVKKSDFFYENNYKIKWIECGKN